jgi:hypothetical protein
VSYVGLLTVPKHAVIIRYQIVQPASFCDIISGFPKQIRKLGLHKNKYDINKWLFGPLRITHKISFTEPSIVCQLPVQVFSPFLFGIPHSTQVSIAG